jgi:hypothetical protein
MCKGHWCVGPVGGQPAKLPGRPAPLCSLTWVSFVVTLSKTRWNGTRGLESVETTLDGRSATWLGWPANTWWITDLIKSITAPRTHITPPPLPMEFNTPHNTCSSPLVKVSVVEAQVKPCRESRVESSLCSRSGSSLGDRWALVSLPFFIYFEL